MSDDMSPTVRNLHRKAMQRSEEARQLMDKALEAYRQAAAYERMALDRVRDTPDNEPTCSILERSWKSLDLLGQGKVEEARALEASE